MNRALFLCSGARMGRTWKDQEWTTPRSLEHRGDAANMQMRIEQFGYALGVSPQSPLFDILRIAAYVYVADQSVSRGGDKDVYGTDWRRQLGLVIPVADPSLWSASATQSALRTLLAQLTQDAWEFEFVPLEADAQPTLALEARTGKTGADTVCLFSGGTDSLCATIDAVRKDNARPILLSHFSPGTVSSRQESLAASLEKRLPIPGLRRIECWITRSGGDAPEPQARSRSLLHAAIGVTAAVALGLNEVRLADNGVVSLNLPINAQLVGARASRTTHPKSLWLMNRLFQAVFATAPSVINPLAELTREEVLSTLTAAGLQDLLRETVSCSRTRGLPADRPHCGVCSQCVGRRYATEAVGLAEWDGPALYVTDIFRHPLTDQNDARTVVLGFIRLANNILDQQDADLFETYPELSDVIQDDDLSPAKTVNRYIAMLRRHASSVRRVTEIQMRDALPDYVAGRLQADSLFAVLQNINKLTPEVPSKEADPPFSHSDDYRSVRWRGRPYALTLQQAQVVEILHQAWKAGHPDVSQLEIMDRVGNPHGRLRGTFRGSGLFGNGFLVTIRRRGLYRLDI